MGGNMEQKIVNVIQEFIKKESKRQIIPRLANKRL